MLRIIAEQRDLRYAALESLRSTCGDGCLEPVLALLRAQKQSIAETTAAVMDMIKNESSSGGIDRSYPATEAR